MSNLEKRITKDGSISFYNKEIGDIYHSDIGAYTEALEKFILPSKIMEKLDNYSDINVLDVCFGLGYNTKVLINSVLQSDPTKKVNIIAIELDPYIIEKSIEIDFIDYNIHLKEFFNDFLHKVYYTTISNQYNSKEYFEGQYNNINFKIFIDDARKILKTLNGKFDIILHDPFSPKKLPELWTTQIFQQYYRLLDDDGLILTYSSASSIHGAMQKAGLHFGYTKPIGRNTPGTIASKNINNIEHHLSQLGKDLLESKAGIPYEDIDMLQSSTDIRNERSKKQDISSRIGSSRVRKKYKYNI